MQFVSSKGILGEGPKSASSHKCLLVGEGTRFCKKTKQNKKQMHKRKNSEYQDVE